MKSVPIVELGCRELARDTLYGSERDSDKQAIDGAHLATEARLPNSRVSYDRDLDSAHG
jgi:hypothetical protein